MTQEQIEIETNAHETPQDTTDTQTETETQEQAQTEIETIENETPGTETISADAYTPLNGLDTTISAPAFVGSWRLITGNAIGVSAIGLRIYADATFELHIITRTENGYNKPTIYKGVCKSGQYLTGLMTDGKPIAVIKYYEDTSTIELRLPHNERHYLTRPIIGIIGGIVVPM